MIWLPINIDFLLTILKDLEGIYGVGWLCVLEYCVGGLTSQACDMCHTPPLPVTESFDSNLKCYAV